LPKKCGFIALAGRPNAGKSTFLNFVLGEKVSIVSDKPQTTRNRILGVYHRPDAQIGFIDLPGVHKPKHRMNRLMMKTVGQGLQDADVILHFVDLSQPLGSGDRWTAEFLAKAAAPIILVANKMDLVNRAKALPKLEALHRELQATELVPISAKTGDNVDRLLSVCLSHLSEGEALFEEDALTDQPLRFMAQEFIREKILHYTRDELPHAAAVALEHFQYDEESGAYIIAAVVWVERPSQRRIMLGAQGTMIKKITQGARRSLKQLLEKPVTLELFVKVREKWRDQERDLSLDSLRLNQE